MFQKYSQSVLGLLGPFFLGEGGGGVGFLNKIIDFGGPKWHLDLIVLGGLSLTDLGTFPKFCQYLQNSSRGDLFTHWLTHLSISKSSEHCNDYNDYNDYNAYQDYKNYKEYNN